ncbi:MAG: leucyl/phenylalanyl-tRNA--protein transferase [Erythrobacter sp. 34-65-8]|nr:MAG: leucyl/phenylalanyl-tRNA--protein transferase [Erythrobacter sp. 34-65-8]
MHQFPAPPIPVEMLLLAYRSGIFPMADARDDPELFWVEPRERAILPLDGFRCSASLRKVIRQDRFRVTVDAAFGRVIAACAEPRDEDGGSWISDRIEASYLALHRAGHAHSVECWHGSELVGGLYGVAFERVFCGESMFSRADNASKVALAWLVALMRRAGYRLLDCQFMTGHLASLGAVEIPQARYLEMLAQASGPPDASLPQAYASVSSAAAGAGAEGGAAVGDGAGAGAAAGAPVARGEGDATEPSSPGKLIAQSFTQTS